MEDTCDFLSKEWDIHGGVRSLEGCFALCSESAYCRRDALVYFNEGKRSCILDASCAPTELGYVTYRADGEVQFSEDQHACVIHKDECDYKGFERVAYEEAACGDGGAGKK